MRTRTIEELTRLWRNGNVVERRQAREELASRKCYCDDLDDRADALTAFECSVCRAGGTSLQHLTDSQLRRRVERFTLDANL